MGTDHTDRLTSDCLICQRSITSQDVVYHDAYWVVRHSQETNILGYFLLESRRHFLDLSQAVDAEVHGYGQVLRVLMQAIKEVIDCPRIYTFSLGEAVPHYHLHVVPRTESMPKGYRARGILQYPLSPAADPALVAEASSRVNRAMDRLSKQRSIT